MYPGSNELGKIGAKVAQSLNKSPAKPLDSLLILPAKASLERAVNIKYRENLLAADLFARWNLPAVVVARTMLGTINHTLLTLEALRVRGIAVAGVAFMGEAEPVAERAIVDIGQTPHLGRLPFLDPLNAQTLADAFAQKIRLDLLRD